jgi:type IV secretory pathway VirB4 component
MELLYELLTGRRQVMPLVRGHLGSALYDSRLIFGRETIEIRGAGEETYAGMFGVKEYPAATRPGLWNGLLQAPFAFAASQSFTFLSKPSAKAVLERRQNLMVRAGDRAASQIDGLDDALDDLVSNRFVVGDHQFSLLVHGESQATLKTNLSLAKAALADSGMLVAREDLALEGRVLVAVPGNFGFRTRPAAINSRNFAALAPLHTYPAGRASGNHWGRRSRCCARPRARPTTSTSTLATSATPSSAARPAAGRPSSRTSCWLSWRSSTSSRSSSTRTAARRSSSAPAAAATWRCGAEPRRASRLSRRSHTRPRTSPSCAASSASS